MRLSLLLALTAVSTTSAGVTLSIDLVDPADGIAQPPPGVIAIDVLADLTPDDGWVAAGLFGVVTPVGQAEGVTLRYAPDNEPNNPSPEYLLNPGTANRFVTFITRPRLRDADIRYTSAGAAIAGAYATGGPVAVADPLELDVRWFTSAPEPPPSVDGAIARIALDVSSLLASHPGAAFAVGRPSDAAGPIIFRSELPSGGGLGTISVSYDDPTVHGLDWAVWYIPEPASLAIFFVAAVAVRRKLQPAQSSLRVSCRATPSVRSAPATTIPRSPASTGPSGTSPNPRPSSASSRPPHSSADAIKLRIPRSPSPPRSGRSPNPALAVPRMRI